jgi:LPXTG-motif cell wall-anchored protein
MIDPYMKAEGMKKFGIAVFGVVGFTLLSVTSALAQSTLPDPDVRGEVVVPPGEVVVPPGAGPGGTAFTGTDITVWMIMAAALLLLGVGFLLVARRRARGART